jgi:rare lipoprotein A
MKGSKIYTIVISLLVAFMFGGCSTRGKGVYRNVSNVSNLQNVEYVATPTGTYTSQLDPKMYKHPTMNPYNVHGKRYYPHLTKVGEVFKGRASWYGPDFHGKLTSNGEIYDMHAMTAAHKTLPISTVVRVTNLKNGLSTVVRINDRGPFVDTRIIDLSNAAAKQIDMVGAGTAPVKLEVLGFKYKGKLKPLKKKKKKNKTIQNIIAPYALQIASFTKIEGAIATQEMYDGKDGYSSVIVDNMKQNNSTYKVMLRGFKSRDEVVSYKEKENLNNAFIIKEDKK